MSFASARVRQGEIIAAAGAVALAVCMFLLPWYGLTGRIERLLAGLHTATSVDGWNGLTINRWLMLVTIVVTLVLFVLQGTRRAPALPVSLSVVATVLGIVTSLVLIDRVLIDTPFSSPLVETKVGAYLGLVSSLVLSYGAIRSLREEDPPDPARNADIPTVTLPSER
jgi:hypothetical protein